jgi:RHS repeat-associated protein
VTDDYGILGDRYEYDIFGEVYEGDLGGGMNLGYTGKPYDVVTGMYNYGYRDYKAEAGRFTTEDPIRDGNNWYAYVNNDPVNWVDPSGEFPVLIGMAVGFFSSSIVEVGGRMLSGQTFTEAIYNTVHDPVSMTNIAVSTILGGATAGFSSLAVNSATKGIQATAAIGVNTMGKEAVAAVAINTVSGAVNAGAKDVTIKALTGQKQDFVETAKKVGEGALYASITSIGTQAVIAVGTNVSTYTYNGLERSVSYKPQWNGVAGVIGESVLPDAFDTVVSLGKQVVTKSECSK